MQDSRSESETVEYEHVIQLKLVDSLAEISELDSNRDTSKEILDQFIFFSEAHFISEQLLMRLHAYPQYAEHTKQHEVLLESCATLQQALAGGDWDGLRKQCQRLKENLQRHIQGSDRKLGAFLNDNAR